MTSNEQEQLALQNKYGISGYDTIPDAIRKVLAIVDSLAQRVKRLEGDKPRSILGRKERR